MFAWERGILSNKLQALVKAGRWICHSCLETLVALIDVKAINDIPDT